jgi:hypothetical protein
MGPWWLNGTNPLLGYGRSLVSPGSFRLLWFLVPFLWKIFRYFIYALFFMMCIFLSTIKVFRMKNLFMWLRWFWSLLLISCWCINDGFYFKWYKMILLISIIMVVYHKFWVLYHELFLEISLWHCHYYDIYVSRMCSILMILCWSHDFGIL